MFKRKTVSVHAPPGPPKHVTEEKSGFVDTKSTWESVKDRFKVERHLGAGSYGVVYEVQDASGNKRAAKIGKIGAEECQLMQDVYDVSKLSPNVYECGIDYIIMELIYGEPLLDWIAKVTDPKIVIAAFKGLFDLYKSMLQTGVAHTDLHGGNIIVTDHGWRIVDFGMAHRGSEHWKDIWAADDLVRRLQTLVPAVRLNAPDWTHTSEDFLQYIAHAERVIGESPISESMKIAHLLSKLCHP